MRMQIYLGTSFLAAPFLVAPLSAGLFLSGCGNDGSCEVTLTCEAPAETGGGGSATTAAGGSGGQGAGSTGGSGGAPGLANGEACSDGDACSSGFCTDGVCCENECASGCAACNATGSEGVCTPHEVSTDPESACSSGAGVCDGNGACADGTQDWQLEVGDNNNQTVSYVAADATGHVVIAGVHGGVAAFSFGSDSIGPGPFVAKISPTGSPVWGKTLSACSPGDTNDDVHALATAPNGNIIVAASCDSGYFLRAYGPDGAQLWTNIIGVSATYFSIDLATDSESNLYVGGQSAYVPLNFDGNSIGPPSLGNEWAFVVKMSPLGDYAWAQTFESPASVYASDIEVTPSDEIVFLTRFTGTAQFGNETLTSPPATVVVTLSTTSTVTLVKQVAGGAYDKEAALAVAANGIHVASVYQGNVDLGGGPLGEASGNNDVYRLHLDAAGDHISSTGYGSSGDERIEAMEADVNGNIAFVLSNGAADFGGGQISAPALVKMGAEGTFLWQKQGTLSEVAIAPDGTVIAVGGDLVTAYRP